MNLYPIHSGYFKLDGGAMFGVVPKTLWERFNPPDENNLCTWAMRCLLVEHRNRKILIDSGIGDKQSEKFFSLYQPHGEQTLPGSLQEHGFSPEDITDVIHTHLHFDHCGGAIKYDDNGNLAPTFPNATYWTHKAHWDWANNPNAREKASFLPENIRPMEDNGVLRFAEEGEFLPDFELRLAYGHTESMFIPVIHGFKDRTIAYMADLLPSHAHIPVPWVMAFDVRPLNTMDEKQPFLKEAYENNYVLMFEHDKDVECCNLKWTDKGARMNEQFKLDDL